MADMYSGYQAGLYGIQGAASLAGAYVESQAMKEQSSFQRTMAAINARLAKRRADETIKVGEEQANAIRRKGKQVMGSQRAAAAAQGIETDGGSTADLLADSETAITTDMLNTRNNAWREAWGIKAQSAFDVAESGQRATAMEFQANQTLLTGGLKALGYGAEAAGKYGKGAGKGDSDKVDGYSGSVNTGLYPGWWRK